MACFFFLRSVGCTVIEMLTGKPPLSYLQTEEARFKIASGPINVMTLVPWKSQDARAFIVAALKWLVTVNSRVKQVVM